MAGMDISGLKKGLAEFQKTAQAKIGLYAETSAVKIQGHMQDNAPWTDRTGDARKRLSCKAYPIPNGWVLVLAHGVDYGIWLELIREKKYAVIDPTIKEMSPEIMSGLHKLLEKVGR